MFNLKSEEVLPTFCFNKKMPDVVHLIYSAVKFGGQMVNNLPPLLPWPQSRMTRSSVDAILCSTLTRWCVDFQANEQIAKYTSTPFFKVVNSKYIQLFAQVLDNIVKILFFERFQIFIFCSHFQRLNVLQLNLKI